MRLPGPGIYLLNVTHPGFFPLKDQRVLVAAKPEAVQLVLNHATEIFSSVEVHADPATTEPDITQDQKTLTAVNLINIPYTGRDTVMALQLMPNVVKDSLGTLHLSGGSVNQVLYTLDGFNITNPVTGTMDTRLNVDAVRSIDYSTGRYSPEYGKGSAGTVAIHTTMGTDQWQYNATNFVPGVDTSLGVHIGTWSPRFELSGPLVKKRAWFTESAEAVYSQLVVPDVQGRNSVPTLRADNLLRAQINLTPKDLLFASFLTNFSDSPGSGLGALDPYSTTINRRSRTWFTSLKYDKYLANGSVLELGYGESRTFDRQIPQGSAYYQMTPYGRLGNYFLNSTEESARQQILTNYSARPLHFWGTHQLKAGTDVDRIEYHAINRRTGYEQFDLSNRELNLVTFGGNGIFSRPNTEASSFLMDSWKIRPSLSMESGIRQDWDELLRNVVFSPRISMTWSPFGWKNTRLAAGYAVTRDVTALSQFARPLDQYSITVNYGPNGQPTGAPFPTYFRYSGEHLTTPLYRNWTAALEQKLPHDLSLRVNYLSKRGYDGLTYVAVPDLTNASMAVFDMVNFRRDIVDSVEITAHQQFGKQYEWMASYTRSRALSNAVLDLSVDEPLWVQNNVGRMPWDAPNHFLAWGHFPTKWRNWSVAFLVDARNGFPYSETTVYGAIVGDVNAFRYPAYFDLDVYVERRLELGKRRVALRGGFVNVTNHQNPTVVNSIVGAPDFLHYYGSLGRHVVFRLRWLGTGEY